MNIQIHIQIHVQKKMHFLTHGGDMNFIQNQHQNTMVTFIYILYFLNYLSRFQAACADSKQRIRFLISMCGFYSGRSGLQSLAAHFGQGNHFIIWGSGRINPECTEKCSYGVKKHTAQKKSIFPNFRSTRSSSKIALFQEFQELEQNIYLFIYQFIR